MVREWAERDLFSPVAAHLSLLAHTLSMLFLTGVSLPGRSSQTHPKGEMTDSTRADQLESRKWCCTAVRMSHCNDSLVKYVLVLYLQTTGGAVGTAVHLQSNHLWGYYTNLFDLFSLNILA